MRARLLNVVTAAFFGGAVGFGVFLLTRFLPLAAAVGFVIAYESVR